jgi:NitT/TauT family transport system permease protein
METAKQRSFYRSTLGHSISAYWGIALVFVAWIAGLKFASVNAIVFPSINMVIKDLITNPTVYLNALGYTATLATIGLAVGLLLGAAMAVVSWGSVVFRSMLLPLGLLLSSIPVVAIIPIITRLCGPGDLAVLCVVAVITFLPAFVSLSSGLISTTPSSEQLFIVMGAGRWARFRYLALPSSVPHALMGLSIAAPSAIMAAMTAEYLIGTQGLGYELRSSMASFAVDRVVGAALISTMFAVVVLGLIKGLEKFCLKRWS